MLINLGLRYEHPKGAIHKIWLYRTPNTVAYSILGAKPSMDENGEEILVVAATYEEIRDRYLAWVKVYMKGCFRFSRTKLKKTHKVWTAAGFTAKWYVQ